MSVTLIDTINKITKRFEVDVDQIIRYNKGRKKSNQFTECASHVTKLHSWKYLSHCQFFFVLASGYIRMESKSL